MKSSTKHVSVQESSLEQEEDPQAVKMISFLENTIFNKKRKIIKSMDYKYTETQADLLKL